METSSFSAKNIRMIRWIARILGTFLVIFFLFFFIADIINKGGLHSPDLGHVLITTLFLLSQAGLLIAWRWEGPGGILAVAGVVLAYLLNLFWVHTGRGNGVLTLIWLIPASLFLYCWRKDKRQPA